MSRGSSRILKTTLSALHYVGADQIMTPITGGAGVIFMLHHVSPIPPQEFEPNSILKVTPDFLESVIVQVRAEGFDIISLDDVAARLKSSEARRPFAVFTLDDGYRDNRDYAYPIFKRHNVPFTIYVPADYADGNGELWWLALERALQQRDFIDFELDGTLQRFELGSADEKNEAFDKIYWSLRAMPENRARAIVRELCETAGVDQQALCRELVMNWDEVRELAGDPLVTIGAHSLSHYALGKVSAARARHEMAASIARVSSELGKPCRHFSYPYGCEESAGDREFEIARDLGVETAVTTRKGLLHTSHANAMTALPRLSLNGDFQENRYIKVLLSGLPFAMFNTAKRMKKPVPAIAAAAVIESLAAPITTLVAALR